MQHTVFGVLIKGGGARGDIQGVPSQFSYPNFSDDCKEVFFVVFNRRLAITAFVLLTLLTATAFVSAQVTTITYYDAVPAGAATEMMDILVAEFEAQNPDIKVEVVRSGGYNATREKAFVAYAGGAAPNLIMMEQAQGFAFTSQGLFLPLDDFIENDPSISLDDIYPGIVEHVTWKGQVWGLPYNISTPLIYYNADLFQMSGLSGEPPRTWSDILEFSRAIARDSDGDGNTDVWGMDFYQWGWLFEAWIGQNGARVANDEGTEFLFNSEEAIEAMEFTQALVREHGVARQGTGINDFWAGRLGMTERSTASLANNIKSAGNSGFDMQVAPLACNVQCYSPIGGGNLHMFNTGTDAEKEATWRFVSFLLDSDNLARLGAATGYMAGRRSSIQSPYLQEHFMDEPRAIVTYQQLNSASPRAKVPIWPDMLTQIASFGTRQHRDGANVREELNELVRIGNQLLNDWYATH